jgi:NADPH:quinone reductase-like Zn-dependent oxidoreductase
MSLMRAIVLRQCGGPEQLRLEEWPVPHPGPGEAVVRLRAAAINHRDIWIRRGRYASIRLPAILGSDGAGEVVRAGDSASEHWLGRDVVIDPSMTWGPDPRAQGSAFNLLGMPTDGTYAEFVKVPTANLHEKPEHLSVEEAAALPLASVTAYRALVTRAAVQPGEVVVVTGIGGGVAQAAMSIAKALGATVYVTSGSDDKIAAATALGAAGGVNHRSPEWPRTLVALVGRRPDVIIDGAGGETFNDALDVVRPGGRLVSYGATLGPASRLEVRRIFWKQLDIRGTTMGTPDDFRAMVRLYATGIRPVVDRVFPLAATADAHARVDRGEQFGKVVLTI